MAAKLVHSYPLAWEAQTPEATITVTKQEDGTFKSFTPNVPALDPRYGETRSEAIQASQRQLWAYFASGNDTAKANKEK